MATVKQYIGSAKKHSEYDSVTVTLDMDKAMTFAADTERGKRLTFLVSARREKGKFGATHSVFVLVDQPETGDEQPTETAAVAEPEVEAPAEERTGRKRRGSKA